MIKPLNENQEKVLKSTKHLILYGYAGTGKTFLALAKGIFELNRNNKTIIIVRSAVSTRDVGFMPGTLEEKVKYFEAPYEEMVRHFYPNQKNPYRQLRGDGKIIFQTTSFIRGLTLENCTIILDEAQNLTFHELDSIITRIGSNAHIYICGDNEQSDISNSGFSKFMSIIRKMPGSYFEIVNFTKDDIVRSKLVKDYIVTKYENRNIE